MGDPETQSVLHLMESDLYEVIEAAMDESIKDNVFLAGAKLEKGVLKTSGGRVLSVIGTGKTLEEAREEAYRNVELVDFMGAYCRKDIGIFE